MCILERNDMSLMKRIYKRTEIIDFETLPNEVIRKIFWIIFEDILETKTLMNIAFVTRLVSKLCQSRIETYILGEMQIIPFYHLSKMNDNILPFFSSLKELMIHSPIAITSNSLSKLTKLESLALMRNPAIELQKLKALPNLSTLMLIDTHFAIIDLPNLSNLVIESMYCINNDTFKSLTQLRSLSLKNTNIKASHLSPLVSTLRQLNFRGGNYSIDPNEPLPFLSQLERLILNSDALITNQVISSLSSITELNMTANNITISGLRVFSNTLRVITFFCIYFEFFEHLNEFPKLTTIGMKKCTILPEYIIELEKRKIELIFL